MLTKNMSPMQIEAINAIDDDVEIIACDANHNNRLFNFLLFLFPHYLKAAMRKGLFKKYIRRRYNDGNVKGTIDVARHIKKNTPFAGMLPIVSVSFLMTIA